MTHISDTWTVAERLCWDQVVSAVEVQKIVNILAQATINVDTVLPIVSTTKPSLILTPHSPDDQRHLQSLCRAVSTALSSDGKWVSVQRGDYWSLVLRHGNVAVEVSTYVPVAKPVAFEVDV